MKLKQKLPAFLVLIMSILLVQACRKFDFFSKEGKPNEFKMEDAKEWYYGVFKKTSTFRTTDYSSPFSPDKRLLTGAETNDTFYRKYPYWNEAISYARGSMQIVETPLFYEANVLVLPGMQNLTSAQRKLVAEGSLHKVLFFKKTDNSIVARTVTMIPALEYLQSKNYDISNNTIQNPDSEFDGFIVIKDWQNKVINILEAKNGKYTRRVNIVKSPTKPQSKNRNGNNSNTEEECGWTEITTIIQYCISVGNTSGDVPPDPDDCEEWEERERTEWEFIPCEHEDPDPFQECILAGYTNDECSCQIYGVGCPNNNDPNDPQVPLVNEIDNLTDPCLTEAKAKITNSNLKNFINKLYNSSYVNNTGSNLSWNQVSSIPGGGPAQSGLSGNTWMVELSLSFLQTYGPSQEYVGAVMLHEIVHAFIQKHYSYLGVNGDNWTHHSLMFFNWTNHLRDALKEAFNLSDQTATALALGGISDVLNFSYNPNGQNTAFRDFMNNFALTNYNISLNTAQTVQNLHKNGALGTDCP
jgi:hypothetical protein